MLTGITSNPIAINFISLPDPPPTVGASWLLQPGDDPPAGLGALYWDYELVLYDADAAPWCRTACFPRSVTAKALITVPANIESATVSEQLPDIPTPPA